ncbi:Ketosamine-3-kinase [Xylona heveae TC161]|uniref:protein-ribulosamine 3-kinase n=1 Tax=Xylona heveae (strain CBS 132557 / TC161) TaxID=1328760 RepID=A0A165F960_XYLHT|nr:Ketosamine-3-kinase [Xylona heveae TC161]KZF20724.1 Ketosamine-3-kinase [Xylona heveae TC161]
MKLDSAIVKALSLDPAVISVASHGGSGFSSTSKVSTTVTSPEGKEEKRNFFVKTGKGRDAEIMFEGEHTSLNAIHDAVPSLCPASLAWGKLSDSPGGAFLVTEFLDLGGGSIFSPSSSSSSSEGSGMSLAQKLAKLHTTPAPPPHDGSSDKPMFGFPATTCCGDTAQPNDYKASWAEFYAENRLRFILRQSESTNGADDELRSLVKKTADVVVPRLIGDEVLNNGKGVTPVVTHGDLWSGNKSRGTIGGRPGVEDVVFDPSACYAHGEFDHGIMSMFGGFGKSFWDEYHRYCPKTEPQDQWEDRVALYELYHHLNHHAIFGGYRAGAVSIMKKLWKKYGD